MKGRETFNTKIHFKSFSHAFDISMYIFPYLCVVFRDYFLQKMRRARILRELAEMMLIDFNC